MTFDISSLTPIAIMSCLLSLAIHRTHLLISLLALEAAILAITLLTALLFGSPTHLNAFLCVVILTFGACEASLGLALLVSMTRSYGTDMVKSLSINKCLN